jgi:hypothetical protein
MSMFIMCSILAINLYFFSQDVTAKIPANKLIVIEWGNFVLQEKFCSMLQPMFIQYKEQAWQSLNIERLQFPIKNKLNYTSFI